ncbi:MAG: hypothetical protein C0617_12025 [Desulfuromonas sp.]|uniref:hypothetical protein n=1 Tax=Desulfuromonas sp. TaxID=892 RepID=UPI000CB1C592|nr:hypothetical protein [Desulfuromonas sp.]PLX83253.1 MAG: hypothetical protein C0617_12025 [Desulfuromonas sp.]
MKSLLRFVLWTVLFFALLLGADQLLTRVPLSPPVLNEAQRFYRDFRIRLIGLGCRGGETVEGVIEGNAGQVGDSPAATSGEGTPRYFYLDREGALRFVDDLKDVPPEYRGEAQVLVR